MGFAQLYYTSCETGLSDFAGFQFNAATPGLPAQVLREVEALTSYEPPRSLGYRPSSAEIAACPVNLVYRCEPTPVLANVVFVGLDFSQRLGNYFAHALVAQSGADQFDGVLPIELWGSSVWAAEPIADRELPALTDLPDSASNGSARRISRDGVDRFLAPSDRSDHLAALVTAAEAAVMRQGRSIVIIEADSTAAAQWIAAISFLLPPALARRMSFTTYRHRPEYSDAHVIATLPDSDFDLDDSTFHSYVVFDAASGRISDVTPDPAATLLVRAGAVAAARLWDRAGGLVDLTGFSLEQCRPVLVAAAVLERIPFSDSDLRALGEWLRSSPDGLAGPDRSALLAGVIEDLALRVSEDPEAVIEIFDTAWGHLIEDDGLTPELRRAALLARCRRDLLGPTVEPVGADWLVRALVDPARDSDNRDGDYRNGDYLPAYRSLCRAIEDGTVTVSLPRPAQVAVASFLETDRELEQARRDPGRAATVGRLAGSYPQQGVPVQDLLRAELPTLIDQLAGSPELLDAVRGWPEPVVTAYLETARDRVARIPPDVQGVARLLATRQRLGGAEPVIAPALDEVLRRGLRSWPAEALDQVRDHLGQLDPGLAAGFTGWRARHLGRFWSRSLRRLTQRGSGG
jgi:hypothetical protein